MTPENIAGFTVPKEQLQDLLDALAAMQPAPSVIPLPRAAEPAKAA